MNRPLRVFVSAGEASGDAILGKVLARLRAEAPGLELAGLGGPGAEAQGLRPLFPISRTAFSGAGDALARAPFALRLWFAAARKLREFRPDLVLLVDYPGLNLRLARLARGLGIPVHFIAPPQAWALPAARKTIEDPRTAAKERRRSGVITDDHRYLNGPRTARQNDVPPPIRRATGRTAEFGLKNGPAMSLPDPVRTPTEQASRPSGWDWPVGPPTKTRVAND